MSEKNDGGPAFPVEDITATHTGRPGMSLRDYFAGQALIAKIADNEAWNEAMRHAGKTTRITKEETAATCYAYADAMLKERDR